MAQPDYVPVTPADKVRPAERMPVPQRWVTDRPGELAGLRHPVGSQLGRPGPDQGYGLKLARRLVDRLELEPNEHADDAVSGCLGVGLKRASLFGRAPVIYDFELAFTLWGFLGGAPRELIEFRRRLFEAASHDYTTQRRIADLVPESTLALTPADVRSRLSEWRDLVVADTVANVTL